MQNILSDRLPLKRTLESEEKFEKRGGEIKISTHKGEQMPKTDLHSHTETADGPIAAISHQGAFLSTD